MIPYYLKILGKINAICCSIIALIIFISGLKIVYESLKELYYYGSFWDFLFFWEYAGILFLFLPLIVVVIIYGALFNEKLKNYNSGIKYFEKDFILTLNINLFITSLVFIYSIWQHFIIVSILIAIPLIYFIAIYHYIKTKPLQ
jgi:divalent metal cation (Fe/Co/Zn/Cd) transporter